jgi:hypothetical protein
MVMLFEETSLFTVRLFLIRFTRVVLPARANDHHEHCNEDEHQHMGKLIGRNDAKIILLALCDLFLHSFL